MSNLTTGNSFWGAVTIHGDLTVTGTTALVTTNTTGKVTVTVTTADYAIRATQNGAGVAIDIDAGDLRFAAETVISDGANYFQIAPAANHYPKILATDIRTTGAYDYGLLLSESSSAVVTGTNQYLYGISSSAAKTGADTSVDTTTLYGVYGSGLNTGATNAGTKNTYGGYFIATGDTAGTSTAYGIYATASGADTNYAAYLNGDVLIPDDKYYIFGNVLATPDAGIGWNTTQTVDGLFVGLSDAQNTLVIAEYGDRTFDFAHGAQTNPTVFVHDATQSTSKWLSFTHNGTNGLIDVGTGIILLNDLVGETVNTTGFAYDFQLGTGWTSGTIINADFTGATTQSGNMNGIVLDFNTNLAGVTDQDVNGFALLMPAITQTAANTTSYIGYSLPTAGALVQNTNAGTINWTGMNIQCPNITQTTGTVNSYGVYINGGTVTSGTEYALFVDKGLTRLDGDVFIPDDTYYLFGNVSGTPDAGIGWNTTQTVDGLFIGLSAAQNTLVVAEYADRAFDFAHGAQTNPTLFIQSAAQSTTQWLSLSHNQTDAYIQSGAGLIRLLPVAGSYTIIGDAGTTAHAFNTNDDLMVSGRFEVKGLTYLDGAVSLGGGLATNGTPICNVTNTMGSDGAIYQYVSFQTLKSPMFTTGTVANHYIMCEVGDVTYDFAHTQQTNPTLFIQSAAQSTTQWGSFAHNQTDFLLTSGAGLVRFGSNTGKKTSSTLTAGTTQTQAGGTAIVSEITNVSTCANLNDTVVLPLAVAAGGQVYWIFNNGAQTVQIFPGVGDNLGAGADTATTLAAGKQALFISYDATNWQKVTGANLL